MKKIRVVIVGYGNIGQHTLEALLESPDMLPVGIVRRDGQRSDGIPSQIPVTNDVTTLGGADVAILCSPSRAIPQIAPEYLSKGIHTVDSYDIHGPTLLELRRQLHAEALKNKTVAILSAGWDPGSDSVIRTLLQAFAPKGITHTNFGPGMSMGHSVCARSKPGVLDALSMTIPTGNSIHRRMVYVKLAPGASLETVSAEIKKDPYFAHDDTSVIAVSDVDALRDMGHATHIQRKGVSGQTHNQLFDFRMSINNPALTAQILVSCARAAMRQKPGAYTMPEIPPIDLLPGEREDLIPSLV